MSTIKKLPLIYDKNKLKLVKKFKIGDKLCHENNWRAGWKSFFTATDYDVDIYSGRNGIYLKEIKP